MTRKNFTIILLIVILIFLCITLGPVFTKDLKDISYSDFQLAIGPFLSGIGVFLSYRAIIKKEKNLRTNSAERS